MESGFNKVPCSIQPTVTVTLPKGFQVDTRGNKSPISLSNLFVNPNCLFFDVIFKQPTSIDYITFRNYYTNTITIQWLPLQGSWTDCVTDRTLMQNCHSEQGSQDNVILGPDELKSILRDATQLRIILKQPSFQWKEYNIYNLTCYSNHNKTDQ